MPSQAGRPGYRVLTPFRREGSDAPAAGRSRLGAARRNPRRTCPPVVRVARSSAPCRAASTTLPVPGRARRRRRACAGDTSWPRVLNFPRQQDLEQALGARVESRIVLLDPAAPDGYERVWRPAHAASVPSATWDTRSSGSRSRSSRSSSSLPSACAAVRRGAAATDSTSGLTMNTPIDDDPRAARTPPAAVPGVAFLRAARWWPSGCTTAARAGARSAAPTRATWSTRPCRCRRSRWRSRTARDARRTSCRASGRSPTSATAPATSAAARRCTCRDRRGSRSTRTWTACSACSWRPGRVVDTQFVGDGASDLPVAMLGDDAASQALLAQIPVLDGVAAERRRPALPDRSARQPRAQLFCRGPGQGPAHGREEAAATLAHRLSVPVNTKQRLATFRKLCLFGTILAFCVIVLGAYVRLSHAGLGCPDWPGCYGHLTVGQAVENQHVVNAAYPGAPGRVRQGAQGDAAPVPRRDARPRHPGHRRARVAQSARFAAAGAHAARAGRRS